MLLDYPEAATSSAATFVAGIEMSVVHEADQMLA
jgi:hypothetical protein